jgi:hypothetical protein
MHSPEASPTDNYLTHSSSSRQCWPLIHQVQLPLEQLFISGAAHVPLGQHHAAIFSTCLGKERHDSGWSAYKEIGGELKANLSSTFPKWKFSEVGLGIQDWRAEPRCVFFNPDSSAGFHFDNDSGCIDSKVVKKLRCGKLSSFTIRATLIAPIDVFSPTILKPVGGEYEQQAVQGVAGSITLMVIDVIEHTPDLRKFALGRGLFSWDFRVRRRSWLSQVIAR